NSLGSEVRRTRKGSLRLLRHEQAVREGSGREVLAQDLRGIIRADAGAEGQAQEG
ncbi:unnamed protein product, partial [Symbiodinium sp. CCMP2592]